MNRRPCQFNDLVGYQPLDPSRASDEAMMHAEIVERLIEWDEKDWDKLLLWFFRMCKLRGRGAAEFMNQCLNVLSQRTLERDKILANEIRDRFDELAAINWDHLSRWIGRMRGLMECGRRVFLWYCFYQSGDHSAIGRTLKEAGQRHGWTKQAEEQELKKNLERARRVLPLLAEAIEQLLRRSQVEDDEGKVI